MLLAEFWEARARLMMSTEDKISKEDLVRIDMLGRV